MTRTRQQTLGAIIARASMFIVVAAVVLAGAWCHAVGIKLDAGRATDVITGAGYTDIQLGDAAAYRCGSDDEWSRTFTATNPSGRSVSGVVCCGFEGCGKSCTIRY